MCSTCQMHFVLGRNFSTIYHYVVITWFLDYSVPIFSLLIEMTSIGTLPSLKRGLIQNKHSDLPEKFKFEDLQEKEVIGRGSYGIVYKARYHDKRHGGKPGIQTSQTIFIILKDVGAKLCNFTNLVLFLAMVIYFVFAKIKIQSNWRMDYCLLQKMCNLVSGIRYPVSAIRVFHRALFFKTDE